jgi:hypothetical protein
MQSDDSFLTASQLRERWGNMGHSTLHRLLESDPHCPKPSMRINTRRFFLMSDVLAYEARQRTVKAAQPKQLRRKRRAA